MHLAFAPLIFYQKATIIKLSCILDGKAATDGRDTHMKHGRLYKNIRIVLSVLIFGIILVLTVLIGYSSYKEQLNAAQSTQKNILLNVQMQADNNLDICFKLAEQMTMDKDILSYINSDDVDYYNLLQVQNVIGQSSLLTQRLGCIWGMFKDGSEHYVTTQGILSFQDLMQMGVFSRDIAADMTDIPEARFDNDYFSAYEYAGNNPNYVSFVLKRVQPQGERKAVYLFVVLNINQITRAINDFDINRFAIRSGDTLIYGTDIPTDAAQTEYSSTVSNLTYSYGSAYHISVFSMLTLVFVLILFSLLGVFAIRVLSDLIYRPVRSMIEKLSDDTDGTHEAEWEETEFISKRFELVETYNRKLNTELSLMKENAKNDFLRNLLFFDNSQSEVWQKNEKYLDCPLLIAVLELFPALNVSIVEVAQSVEGFLEKTLAVAVSSSRIALITQNINMTAFSAALMSLALHLENTFALHATIAISDTVASSASGIHKPYMEALDLLENKYLYTNQIIITPSDMNEYFKNSYYYPLETEQNIIEAVAAGKGDVALSKLQFILDKNLKELQLTQNSVTEFKFAITATIKRLMQTIGKTEADIFGDGAITYLELNLCKTPDELYKKITETFEIILKSAEQNAAQSSNVLIRAIAEYIDVNYQNPDLSLTSLAEHFNLTINHLSRTFKKYNGINFKDYLAEYRIKVACRILNDNPNIKIAELAKIVGYDTSASFIRNFKNIMGVSPGQYRS